MKFIVFHTEQTGGQDLLWGIVRNGHKIYVYPENLSAFDANEEERADYLAKVIKDGRYDGAISWNYFPAVSRAREITGIPYIAWIFDSPLLHIYSKEAVNSCNYIFDFDKTSAAELKSFGINAYHMPLGVNTDRLAGLVITDEQIKKYSRDISFVGSLYQKNPYNKANFSEEQQKEFDNIFTRQMMDWSHNYLYDGLNEENLLLFRQASAIADIERYAFLQERQLYGGFFMARKYAEIERKFILNTLAQDYQVTLYNRGDDVSVLENVECLGAVGYETEAPIVYFASKINLNMTLKSIRSGLPLRVFDVMGAGGFLLSNYQPEFEELYEPGKDVVLYNSMEELTELAGFYLTHERERLTIAMNGYKKTCEKHTISGRIGRMLQIVYGKS